MKKLLFVLTATITLNYSCGAQTIDSAAYRIVEQKLARVNSHIEKQNVSPSECMKLIDFFTALTGISSTSNGNYFGQYDPTPTDLRNWEIWLHINKGYIHWDLVKREVVLSKGVPVD